MLLAFLFLKFELSGSDGQSNCSYKYFLAFGKAEYATTWNCFFFYISL